MGREPVDLTGVTLLDGLPVDPERRALIRNADGDEDAREAKKARTGADSAEDVQSCTSDCSEASSKRQRLSPSADRARSSGEARESAAAEVPAPGPDFAAAKRRRVRRGPAEVHFV